MIKVKRIYEAPFDSDGCRVLVDRLWPRSMSKQRAKLDLWLKEVSPSDKLRKWYLHDPKKWNEFQKRYETELKKKPDLLDKIKKNRKRTNHRNSSLCCQK